MFKNLQIRWLKEKVLDPEIEMGSVELGWGKVFNDVGAVLA